MEKDTESKILDTARKHFVQNGFAGARMQEIADEAGINKAMLHYYFRSKDRLYQEVITQIISTVFPRIAQAMESEGNFRERVEKVVGAYITLLIEQPDIPNFMMSELSQKRERFVEAVKKKANYFPAIQSFVMQMQVEMQEGKIREMPPMQLILNILGMTVFPFIAKPVFLTVFEFPEEDFKGLMEERKAIIIEFIDRALRVD